jgi:hypothetical protein
MLLVFVEGMAGLGVMEGAVELCGGTGCGCSCLSIRPLLNDHDSGAGSAAWLYATKRAATSAAAACLLAATRSIACQLGHPIGPKQEYSLTALCVLDYVGS